VNTPIKKQLKIRTKILFYRNTSLQNRNFLTRYNMKKRYQFVINFGFLASQKTKWRAKLLLLPILFMLLSLSSYGQIAQRGTAVSNSAGTTNMSSIQVNKPTGIVSGDIMIVSILQNETDNDNGGLNSANLTGWTLIDGRTVRSEGTNDGDNAWYGTVLYRIADGTEGASFTFTLPNSRADMALISIVAFSGVTASNVGGIATITIDGTSGAAAGNTTEVQFNDNGTVPE
jgi:hypothetical protein